MIKVLLIEDDLADQLIFKRNIRKCGVQNELTVSETISGGEISLNDQHFDVVFCDYNLPDGTALDILENSRVRDSIPVIVLTSQGDVKKATESLKKGAFDFITKDNVNSPGLERILNNVARSIDENRRNNELEARLEENNANTRAILDNTSDGIWSLDLNHRILIINHVAVKNFVDHFKYAPQIGDLFFENIPQEYGAVFKPLFDQVLEGENVTSVSEHEEDNRIFFLEVSCSPIIKNKTITGVTFFARSVTERVEAERKLDEARLIAEKASLFKSQFLANMSHEIRTPLNAMLGFTDLLVKTTMDEEQKQFAEIIQYSGQDLLIIINDILDLSKIQAGKMKLKLEPFDLHQLIKNITQLHSLKTKEKSNQLKKELINAVPNWIIGDAIRISQILNNLLSNANKFTDNGTITLKIEKLVDENQILKLQFSVCDTGIGIPENEAENIFEEFTQVDSSLQRTVAGTGLGLAIVTDLVQLMQGTIDLKSTLGVGSEFIVTIPYQETMPVDNEEESTERIIDQFAGKKILVCEDVELNRLLAKKVLEQFNAEVIFAENGKVGVAKVKSHAPDLVLMDIQMPIMNGYEAANEIRSFSDVPIIAMTAHILDEERDKCEASGIIGMITKPFKEKDLVKQIRIAFNANEKENKSNQDKWSLLQMPTLNNLAAGDEKFVVEILEMFLETADNRIKGFSKALLNNDLQTQIEIAHKSRSSFITFDLTELSELSIKIEQKEASLKEKQLFVQLFQASKKNIADKVKLFA